MNPIGADLPGLSPSRCAPRAQRRILVALLQGNNGLLGRLQRRIVLLLAAASLACAPAPRMGEAVDIAEESAIIIWDESAKTQHFVRRASFRTKAKDFGFLVPTPTVPELKEADDVAFALLEKLTAPAIVTRNIPPDAKSAAPKSEAPRVTVLATAKVAGYDAVVLEANDANALNEWLKKHGYASTPDLVEWFKPYLERNWKISAFKVDRDAPDSEFASAKAVRMSFRADVPFFPYREPASQRTGSRLPDPRMLRTFVLSASRVEGTFGAAGAWPGKVVWSGRIGQNDFESLLGHIKLPAGTASSALWLTEFEDGSTPRPGTDDVFFRKSALHDTVKRPDEIRYVRSNAPNPSDYVLLGIAAAVILGLLYLLYRLIRMVVRATRR